MADFEAINGCNRIANAYFGFKLKDWESMYTRKIDEDLDCGIRVALKIFGGKWKLCIIDAINKGIVRPVEIHKNIPDSSLRVIEIQLAELLFFGVVDKCSEDVYPKKSEYELTALGKSLLPILAQIDSWGMAHSEFVKERLLELEEEV
ncbi:DNA-binding HxlR family transcriptional regulator [Algoriphagus sp. 4150]|uniref:winged helix-turn-helix transcriptional regulator n=1 Tax=Algoriphagus sp. 4150 TaxID=2817756 RepID=UPI002858EB6D|nr:helix-turn-helix domain-containing protein [Algoriphagus sp. 4150]MDR7132211.1 DNA-binding HxlR family transcriptional regulator [Algoriphagus sp. 4150]